LGTFVTIGNRLKEEREKLGFNQTDFAAIGGVGRKSQFNYEDDERRPDAAYLAAIAAAGADIRYIVTGDREGPPPLALSPDEQVLLDGYRALDRKTQKRMLAFVLGGETSSENGTKSQPKINVGGKVLGQVVEGGLINNAPISFGGKTKNKK
jgi:transcriptional regulator with XRE-family HTH domain